MTNIVTISIVGASAALLFAVSAHAGETSKKVNTQSKITETQNTEVLAAQANNETLVRVVDENGKVYYNQYVPKSRLFDASIDLETVDTYTFTHEGRTYVNKIVEKDK